MAANGKATFSLDPASLKHLVNLSQRWRVSKTEVLRRALRKVAETDAPSAEDRIAALHELQRLTEERGIDLKKWQQTIRDGRR